MSFYIPFALIDSTGSYTAILCSPEKLHGSEPYESLNQYEGYGKTVGCYALEIPAVYYGYGPFQVKKYIVTVEGNGGMVKVSKDYIGKLEDGMNVVLQGDVALASFKVRASRGKASKGVTFFPKPQ